MTDAAVWVVNPDLSVSRIDPRTNRVVAGVAGVRALSIAAGEGEVWIVNDGGEVVEIDPRTNAASKPIPVAAESLTALAVGAGAVWVADPVGGSVWRIDPDPEPILRTIPLEVGVGGVAFGEGAVWATNEIADEVYRIDPDTNEARVVSRMAAPRGIAVGEGAVWVTSAGPPSAEEALPASSCSKLVYGGAGSPRFVIASDLPLQGQQPSGHPAHDGGDPLRPRAARLQGGAIHRRLPVVRRLDGPGRGLRPLQMLLEREGLCP